MTAKTCVVSGGAGFIGSWLCSDLATKGYNVVCVDNMITGSTKNVEPIRKNFTLLKHDVTTPLPIKDRVDFVFHLASPASPVHYQKHPVETLMVNSIGTLNMLKLAAANKARFLYASSSEVYGEPLEHPQKETYWGNVNPNGPRSCYDEGKRFSEALIRNFGVDARTIRIFNTYGPRMNKDDGRVVPNFVNQAILGKPITVYGDGTQTRSFCYVEDTVDGLEKAMFSEKASGETINIGNPSEINMLDLAKIIIKLTGSKSKIAFQKIPVDDPTRRKPDITKAKKLLGWEPKITVEAGMRRTIDYFSKKTGQ